MLKRIRWKTRRGKRFVFDEHTAESLIFYALDLDKAFVLIDEQMLADSAISRDEMKEHAMRNVKRLDTFPKKDEVRGNLFYFISRNDGYAASRILNEKYLEQMKRKVKGDMIVAVPHQDVCIVADIRNDHGYKIIFQLNMDFWAKGDIPISPLPFAYGVERQLEPLMMVDHS